MAQAYLTKENFKQKWDDSKEYMKSLHEPLAEYERIARNRPHPGTNKAYPRNTDGTLSAIIQEFPKRIVQQLPTGKVETTNDPVKEIVATFVLTNEIIPHATTQADVLQKSWGNIGKSLTFGSSYSMTFFNNKNGYFGSDFRLIYIKDLFYESGKLTFGDCNLFFVRAWYKETDIDDIIAREAELKKFAKERGEKYEGEWDLGELKKLKEWNSTKESSAQTASESERNANPEAIEIIHGYQNGVKAKFISYAPGPESFVRETVNKDPRGIMPIQGEYCDIDFENPLGRGVVERSGGTQNVIDSMLQTYQYMRGLSMNPPIEKRGDYNKSTLKYQNGVIWDLGSNPANSATPVKLDTSAIANFTNDYGLFKSQIIAMNNNGDTSVSAEVGNPGFSKTQAGVQAQQLKLGISDNYMRKQYESWISDVFESMLNLHFANKQGVEELQLDKETADRLRDIDPSLVDENDVTIVDYSEYTDVFKFVVDASTSNKAGDQAQLEALDSLLQRIEASPVLTALLQQYPDKAVQIFNQYTKLTAVDDQEKLQIDLEQFQQDQQMAHEQAAQQQAMAQQMPAQASPEAVQEPLPQEMAEDPSQQAIEGEVVDPALANLPDPLEDGVIDDADLQGLDDSEVQFVIALQDRGYDDDQVSQVIVMLRQGMSDEDILAVLGGAQ